MRLLPLAALALLVCASPVKAYDDHYVSGYTTSRGTIVEPHYQTNPNDTRSDNYETQGNYNPHTGAYGTRNPY